MPTLEIELTANVWKSQRMPEPYDFLGIQEAVGIIDLKVANQTDVARMIEGQGVRLKKFQKKGVLRLRSSQTETITLFWGADDELVHFKPKGGSPGLPKVVQVQGPYLDDKNFDDLTFQPVMGGMMFDTDNNTDRIAKALKTFSGFGLTVETFVRQRGDVLNDGVDTLDTLPTARQSWQNVSAILLTIDDAPNPEPAFAGTVTIKNRIQNHGGDVTPLVVNMAGAPVAGALPKGVYYVLFSGFQTFKLTSAQGGGGKPLVTWAFIGGDVPFKFF